MFGAGSNQSSNPQDSERTPLVTTSSTAFNLKWIRVLTCVSSLAEGYDIAVLSGAITRIEDDFELDDWHVGILLGSVGVGMLLGIAVGPVLADLIGRRPVLFAAYWTLVAASIWTAVAGDFWTLVASRILCGVGCFAGAATTALYVAEVSPARLRGFYCSMEDLFLNVGVLLAFTVNMLLLGKSSNDWRITVAIGGIFPLVAIGMATYFMPESPRYMHKLGLEDEGKRLLQLFVDPEEVAEVVQSWEVEVAADAPLLGTPLRRRAVVMGLVLGSMSGFCGTPFLVNLQGVALKHHGFEPHDTAVAQWATAVAKTVVLVVVLPFLDIVGRRPLLLVSLAGLAVGNGCCGLAFTAQPDLAVVVICMSLTLAAFSTGLGPVPFAYIPEIFDTPVRAKGISVSFGLSRVATGVSVVLGPHLINTIGSLRPIFFTYAALSVLNFWIIYEFFPETKGKTLEEMKDVLLAEDLKEPAETGS